MDTPQDTTPTNAQWAIVEIMGHVQTAGRISRPADWGGLLRVDVPCDGSYRTEYYGMAAIYAIKLVSEEIARAYAEREAPLAQDYSAPIVTRSQFDDMQRRAERTIMQLNGNLDELRRRLTAVHALPEPEAEEIE